MALNDFQLKQIEIATAKFFELYRPPEEVRSQVDFKVEVEGQSVVLYEVRPDWQDPSKIMKNSIAKTTYVQKSQLWKVYWQKGDLKWHSYKPNPSVKNVSDFFSIIGEDKYHCFFG